MKWFSNMFRSFSGIMYGHVVRWLRALSLSAQDFSAASPSPAPAEEQEEEEELAVEHGEWQDEEQDDDTCFTCAT